MQSQKWQNDFCSFLRQTIQYHSNLNILYPNHKCWRSWSWTVLWWPTRPSRTPKKDVLFIIGDWNSKGGSQGIPGGTGKFGLGVQNEPGQRLTEFCQENSLVIGNILFQQHKEQLYTWTSSDGQYQVSLIIFFPVENGEALYSQKKKKKKDKTQTVIQVMKSLLQNSDLNWRR